MSTQDIYKPKLKFSYVKRTNIEKVLFKQRRNMIREKYEN